MSSQRIAALLGVLGGIGGSLLAIGQHDVYEATWAGISAAWAAMYLRDAD